MADTPSLALTLMASAQSQKHVTFNSLLYRLEMLVQPSVIDMTTTAKPGSPSEGNAYLIGSGATGDWAGLDDYLAKYMGGQWYTQVPFEGFIVYDLDTSTHVKWNGSTWVTL